MRKKFTIIVCLLAAFLACNKVAAQQANARQGKSSEARIAGEKREVEVTGRMTWHPENRQTLWYTRPAEEWMTSALPIGNGMLGACIMGGVKTDEIQFNEKTLWRGHVGGIVPHEEYGSYLNFGYLNIYDMDGALTGVSNYHRYLNLENACAGVGYEANGVTYSREYFASYPHHVIALRYTASKGGCLNKRIALRSACGALAGYELLSGNVVRGFFSGRALRTGTMKDELFGCAMRVEAKGAKVSVSDADGITIEGADELTVYLSAATNFSPKNDEYVAGNLRDVMRRVKRFVDAGAKAGYSDVRDAHIKDYQSLYERCKLNISEQDNDLPTPELIRRFGERPEENLLLEELYFGYARYLMIASSRGIDLPSNLQGIWNNSNSPAWNADIHSNINVQMNYWLAEATNLSELHLPFLNYIHREACVRPWWRRNAKEIAGQEHGWTLTTENNIYGSGSSWMQNYTIAGAWFCMHLWQHYTYTLDTEYLRKTALPAMRSCCEYWMERLVKAPDGTYECPEEYSPEHGPKSENATAHAQQLVWSLFHNTLQAYREYEKRTGKSLVNSKTRKFLSQLEQVFESLDAGLETEEVNGELLLREWKYTSQNDVPTYNSHRHLSHLIALYPGNQIAQETSPTIFQAAINSLNRRGYEGTGWSIAWKINCHARAKDGNRCERLIERALKMQTDTGFSENGGIYENLWCAHPPFQIDGNFGVAAGMSEMLLQSHHGILELLPALPEKWASGSVSGLRGVGNFDVSVSWEEGRMKTSTIMSACGEQAIVRYNGLSTDYMIKDERGNAVPATIRNADELAFPTEAGSRYYIERRHK